MDKYARISVGNIITVNSIITAFNLNFMNRPSTDDGGEAHSFPEMVYVEKGVHRSVVDGEFVEVEAGQLYIYPPHAIHGTPSFPYKKSEASADIVSFEVSGDCLNEIYGKVFALSRRQRDMLSQVMECASKNLCALPFGGNPSGMKLAEDADLREIQKMKNLIELLLLDLVLSGTKAGNRPTMQNRDNYNFELFEEVVAYMHHKVGENLTVEQICNDCKVSSSKLRRLFSEMCGCSPISYFISYKIGTAKRYIRDTTLTFTQISEKLGFESVHYFSKLFKEKTGITPSEYSKSVYKE